VKVSARKAPPSDTLDVVLEVRLSRKDAEVLRLLTNTADHPQLPVALGTAISACLEEHLKTGYRVSRLVGEG
jgi:hypothetical protein